MASGKAKRSDDLESDEGSSSSWEDVDEIEVDTEDLCHPLLLNTLILEKIFDFLHIPDLLICRRVCREWNKTALLRKVLGCKLKITVSKGNLDRLLRIAQTSRQAFCRKFDFRSLDLHGDKLAKFIRLFGERLNSLDLTHCITSSQEFVLEVFNCPRLEELKIYGALPKMTETNFNKVIFPRLHSISLHASTEYGQVDKEFIRLLLTYAPNINRISIGLSISLWTDLCAVLNSMPVSKGYQVGLSDIAEPLDILHFCVFSSNFLLALTKVDLQNCIISPDFMKQLLQLSSKTLKSLTVHGTQHEIISKAFVDVKLPRITKITLPIDGVSSSDGSSLVDSSPQLARLDIVGIFDTTFIFEKGRLILMSMKEKYFSNGFTRENLQQADRRQEKRREFRKAIALIQQKPQKLEICLSSAFVNSRNIREIFSKFPDLRHLAIVTNSARETVVGLTGIPYRLCKRMAHCKSFSVTNPNQVRFLPSGASLKKLKQLELTILDDCISTELTLLYVIYGISVIPCLEKLSLTNFKISDVAFMILSQNENLHEVKIDGSVQKWMQFESVFKKHSIRSFLLPPPSPSEARCSLASQVVASNPKILKKIFSYLDSREVFECRKVCHNWNLCSTEFRHEGCDTSDSCSKNLCARLLQLGRRKGSPSSPTNEKAYFLGDFTGSTPQLPNVLSLWSRTTGETTIAFVSLGKPALEAFQRDNNRTGNRARKNCQQRRHLEYWYYPDGSDDTLYCNKRLKLSTDFDELLPFVDTLLVIGCWGRKDNGLVEFLNPAWSTSILHFVGLQKEALDLLLPKVTTLVNLESFNVCPFISSAPYCDVTKTHLQILCNSSFKLRRFSMQFSAPSESVIEFVRSQRFTLEVVELHSNVNISDRLTFSMPQLKMLKLDEPPGCLLWTTLNIHSSLESINFGRSNCSLNPVKNKLSPKVDVLDADLEHSATEILCDINWFLESAAARRQGVQKSVLQQGSDCALKFFKHFPFLSSLTLRSVHAHYGLLQGIFKKFTQLKKLALINASGVTDEILTGFSKDILSEMDIMNPFEVASHGHSAKSSGKTAPSIRNLKGLTYLSLDDQPLCTDFSVIFGILRLDQLEYFSCCKWKITDVSIRAMTDVLPSLKYLNTEGCSTISNQARLYFEQFRPKHVKPSVSS